MVTTNMLILKSISSIVIPIIIILLILKIFKNKKKEDISTSTEKSSSRVKKIALISILAIIVVSVIITITNNSHSPVEPSSNSKVDIETNNSIANNKEKEYYDFIDTNDFTLKLTEQETLTLIAEAFNKSESQFEKASDSTSTEKFYTLDGGVDRIVAKITLLNGKTKKITFSYISLANKQSDETISKMAYALTQRLIYVVTRANPEDIDASELDTNVKGLRIHLNSTSNYGVSVSIEVEK